MSVLIIATWFVFGLMLGIFIGANYMRVKQQSELAEKRFEEQRARVEADMRQRRRP